jgi:hypothetical protein
VGQPSFAGVTRPDHCRDLGIPGELQFDEAQLRTLARIESSELAVYYRPFGGVPSA